MPSKKWPAVRVTPGTDAPLEKLKNVLIPDQPNTLPIETDEEFIGPPAPKS